jgi:hypothetical protein
MKPNHFMVRRFVTETDLDPALIAVTVTLYLPFLRPAIVQDVEMVLQVLPLGDNFTTNLDGFAPSGIDCQANFEPERIRFTVGERGAHNVVDFGSGTLTTTFHELVAPYSSVAVIGIVYVFRVGSIVDLAVTNKSNKYPLLEYVGEKLKNFESGDEVSQVMLNWSFSLSENSGLTKSDDPEQR